MARFEKLLEEIGSMSVLELSDFVKELEQKFGVSATPVMAAGAAVAADAQAPAAAEEKSEYKVTLQESGDKKVDVIKALRKVMPNINLTEAKQKVESAPVTIAEGASKEDAQKIKEALEAAGAKVQLS